MGNNTNSEKHPPIRSFTRDFNSDMTPLFVKTVPSNIRTIEQASQLYSSLVDFVKEGKNLDHIATRQACGLLKNIDCQFKTNKTLFELASAPDDTCSGFTESIIPLLTSSNEEIVTSALSFLNQALFHASPEVHFDFLRAGFFELLPMIPQASRTNFGVIVDLPPENTDNIIPSSNEPSIDVVSKQSGSVGVNGRDTLYNRLNSAQKRPIDKMGVAQQIMRKLVGLHRQDPTLSVLTMFSSHSVVFGEDGEVEIALDVGETVGQTRSQTQRTQTCQEGQRTENMTRTEGERKNEQFELLRWRAPETVVSEGKEGQKVDSGSAAVFSLGLVLFEIETGQVHFGEMDALKASRQLKTGILLKLSLVGDSGLRDVIVSCLQVREKDRPGLGEMEEKLRSVEISCGSAVFFDAAQ
ncbi:hypothetical protein BLNAU_5054 [Blattamonas nauphoetae]|uniref:Protein kinase domain-containing protein n=1 Tax=Blattamonas nauphoetae TaxID=2049346 RepID=A0ABQ9Y7Z5_9EUKA|nr:hypothetical protein BLNAU_5054 [Blattamonas nauphoetae]